MQGPAVLALHVHEVGYFLLGLLLAFGPCVVALQNWPAGHFCLGCHLDPLWSNNFFLPESTLVKIRMITKVPVAELRLSVLQSVDRRQACPLSVLQLPTGLLSPRRDLSGLQLPTGCYRKVSYATGRPS